MPLNLGLGERGLLDQDSGTSGIEDSLDHLLRLGLAEILLHRIPVLLRIAASRATSMAVAIAAIAASVVRCRMGRMRDRHMGVLAVRTMDCEWIRRRAPVFIPNSGAKISWMQECVSMISSGGNNPLYFLAR